MSAWRNSRREGTTRNVKVSNPSALALTGRTKPMAGVVQRMINREARLRGKP
jgi:hypothetical protein